jgi:NAD-dependent DNA ligase
LDFEVRGEVIVTKEDFTKGNEALKAEGGSRTQYSNPRNLASGILSRKHHDRHAAPIRLTFMAYALLSKQSLGSFF